MRIKDIIRKKIYGVPVHNKCKCEYLGSDYGGFYIDSSKVDRSPIVYDFGVAEDISFSMAMIEKYNAEVFAYDPTPRSITWVNKNVNHAKFHFYPYGISNFDGEETFFLPLNDEDYSGSIIPHAKTGKSISVKMRTLKSLLEENKHNYISVLKLDIEGSEFKVIPEILKDRIAINQICLETHGRFYGLVGLLKVRQLVKMLKSCGFVIAQTNDKGNEMTFIYDGKVHSFNM